MPAPSDRQRAEYERALREAHEEQDRARAVCDLLESLEGSQNEGLKALHPCAIPAAIKLARLFGYEFDARLKGSVWIKKEENDQ